MARELFTLTAKWENGVKRTFENLDKLNLIITKAELLEWCEQNKYKSPTFEITKQ